MICIVENVDLLLDLTSSIEFLSNSNRFTSFLSPLELDKPLRA